MKKRILKLKLSDSKLFVFFLFIFNITFSQQYEIDGKITDVKRNAISFATITAYNSANHNIVSYDISDNEGNYHLKLEEGEYLLDINYLGYKEVKLKKKITKDETINFILANDISQLDAVTLKVKSVEGVAKNDTIKFNLKRIVNGNEDNLKDIINKLPGVYTDKDGKIIANGKKIDKLLINGKDFFKDQHQLATENIKADMVKDISLYNNYKDLSDLEQKDINKTALNIEIKKEYIGKIKGSVEIDGGLDKHYELKTSIYSFNNKTNVFFIGNSNNIGKQTFSFLDFFNFMGGIDKLLSDNSSSVTLSGDDIPSFLIADNNVKSKGEHLAALNISSNLTNKLKINSYYIFNILKSSNKQEISRNYLFPNNLLVNEYNQSNHNFLTHNASIDVTFKPGNRSVFNYIFNLSTQDSKSIEDNLFNNKNTDSKNKSSFVSFNNSLNYQYKIGNSIIKSTFFSILKTKKDYLSINSDESVLGFSLNSAFQNKYKKIKIYGTKISFKKKFRKKLTLNINYNLTKSKKNLKNNISNINITENVLQNIIENKLGFRLYNNFKRKFNFSIGTDFAFIKTITQNKTWLPYIRLKFNINKYHYLQISYNKNFEYPEINYLSNQYIISDYNLLSYDYNIAQNNILKYDNMEFSYFIQDLFSGITFNFEITNNIGKNVISTNTLYNQNYNIQQYVVSNNNRSSAYISFDKKFFVIPFKFKIRSNLFYDMTKNFIEYLPVNYKSLSLNTKLKISSNFRKKPFNFEIGYRNKYRELESKDIQFINKLIVSKPFINLFFNYKKFNFKLQNGLETYKLNNFSKDFYRLNFQADYKFKKYTVYLKAHDLLNIKNNFLYKNNIEENFVEESKIYTLPGYIIGGVSFKF